MNIENQIIKEVNIPNFLKALFYKSGVIEIVWDTSIDSIEVLHLTKMRQAIYELGEGEKMPVFFTAHDFLQVSDEGRKFAASAEGVKYTLANAVLVDNLSKQIQFNYFVNVNKPLVPTTAFANKEEAFLWLIEMKKGIYSK